MVSLGILIYYIYICILQFQGPNIVHAASTSLSWLDGTIQYNRAIVNVISKGCGFEIAVLVIISLTVLG